MLSRDCAQPVPSAWARPISMSSLTVRPGKTTVFGTAVNAYDLTSSGRRLLKRISCRCGVWLGACGTRNRFWRLGSRASGLNGLVGLKPTAGRSLNLRVVPYCWTLDHVGLMTRTVADCADLLSLVRAHDPNDPASINRPAENYADTLDQDIAGLRIGVPRNFYYERADGEILAATRGP